MNDTKFVILSFEGPDAYAHVGGLGTRVTEMSLALARLGFDTHIFFVGDPDLPGHHARRTAGCTRTGGASGLAGNIRPGFTTARKSSWPTGRNCSDSG